MPTPTGYSYTTFTMLTGNKALDSLLADDYWTGTLFHQSGTPTLLTYSFITTNSYFARDYSPNNEYLNGFTLSSAQENAVNSALSMWSSVANIQFSLVSETISNVGDLRFGGYLGMDQKYAAWAYFPDRTPVAGDVWIGPQTDDPSPVKGSYDYLTFVHEIGHALGLKHPFEASDGNRTILSPSLDDVRFTVMSYNDSYSYQPTTPMLLDILAIQKLYGANTQWQSGNNFYNWAPDQSVFETIWDTGGVDAIDGSNQLQAVRIDLNEGAFSQIGKAFLQTDTLTSFNEGLAIAYGSQIENAYGSAFNDTLIGNNLSNLLDGMAGADTMSGGSGNDIYVVDNVGDVVIETSAFSGEIDSVYSSISYTLTNNVENLTLQGSANLNGTGNFVNNQIYGNAGNNVLDGGLGADILIGGAGNDTYIVDDARDVIFETNAQASEVDTVLASVSYVLSANVENITLTGFSSNFAVGNSQNNVLTGNEGNNVLDGGAGLDTMIGGQGNDTYSLDQFGELALVQELADEGSDTLSVTFNATAQTGTIDLNQSNLNNMENIALLGAGVFSLLGNGLDNTLIGNADSNILDGGSGADTLIGGAGNDVYVVDNASDIVLETSTVSSEIDSVYSTISYTLGANVEYLTLQGNANINGTGNALANLINGNAGDNVLDGGAGGGDVLVGGAGNDTYIVDSLNDAIFETSTVVSEIDTVQSSVDWTLGANLENLVLTGTASIAGTGNELNNLIIGNAGNNILDGGAGADTLNGGAGNDIYVVDNVGDVVTETGTSAAEIDYVYASINYALTNNVEVLTLHGSANLNGTGNTLDNQIYGNSGNNILDGGAGADTLLGGTGNDTYIVDNVGDAVVETSTVPSEIDTVLASVSYTLGANVEYLTLQGNANINGTGNALANLINGNAGDNVLDGGAGGGDVLVGGAGNDTYIIDSLNDAIFETSTVVSEIDTVQSSVDWTLGANLENLVLTGTASIAGTGNALDNLITGNAGNNILDGGAGADTLNGGAGNDIYVVDNIGDVVTETGTSAAEIDYVYASINYALTNNVEVLTLQGSADLNGSGNALNNQIYGNSGNNILDGGTGLDTLAGGTGNDTYMVDDAGDVVVETSTLASEIDTVLASVSYVLSANVENITLTGSNSNFAVGNSQNNVLTGNDGNNVLDGGAGLDTMIGGKGNDTYSLDQFGELALIQELADEGSDTLSVTFNATAQTGTIDLNQSNLNNMENIALLGAGVFSLLGNGLDNTLIGNADSNILDGGSGADTLIGGAGGDIYVVDNVGDMIVETSTLASEIDSVYSTISYTLGANVEYLTLQGNANINGTGNALANLINGNAGDNVLDGGAGGGDVLVGGAGNDTYIVDSLNDAIFETSTVVSEIDTVQSSVDWTLGANLENLVLTGTASIAGTGNALDNLITGNAGNNILDGGAGADTLNGGAGNDIYVVDNIGDVVTETGTSAAEIDYVYASVDYTLTNNVEVLILQGGADLKGTGNALNNQIFGNSGNNIIDGGAGADTLTGGAGADTFVFAAVSEMGIGSNRDVITDFNSLQGDKIDLSQFDASLLSAGFNAFTFIGAGDFTSAGQLRFVDHVLSGNVSGDTGADFEIQLVGVNNFSASDLVA